MQIAVVIPAFRVSKHILEVIEQIGPEVSSIYVVDDKCPEETGKMLERDCNDSRLKVLFHEKNKGVGGATISGFKQAIEDRADIVIKLDGDGQMDPANIPALIQPILDGRADYTKGNRFFRHDSLRSMPLIRVVGNSFLSLINKISSGYWNLMDPTNGYIAIHGNVLRIMRLNYLDHGYFFESDMLYRLNTLRAVVREVPMDAIYRDEESNLSVLRVALEFPGKYLSRFLKRIFYNYYLRDFNACSVELIVGLGLLIFGAAFGAFHWVSGVKEGVFASTGTVMLAALPIILGFQLLLAALNFDVMNVPTEPIHSFLRSKDKN